MTGEKKIVAFALATGAVMVNDVLSDAVSLADTSEPKESLTITLYLPNVLRAFDGTVQTLCPTGMFTLSNI